MGYTYKQKFNKKYGFKINESHSLKEIAKITGYKYKGIKKIFEKGEGAYENNIRSVRIKATFSKNKDLRKYPKTRRLSKSQWAYARVYSAIMKGGAYKYDKNLLIKN